MHAWLLLTGLLLAFLLVGGCSAVVNPDEGRLGAEVDAGPDVTPDGGTPPDEDSGIPRGDAGPPRRDGGGACVPGDRCEGEVLVSCRGGVETRTDCREMEAYCEVDECQSWECTPGEQECTDDLSGVVVCSDRGDDETTMECDLGCNPATNECSDVPAACTGLPSIGVGDEETFDLCSESDDETYVPAEGCGAEARAAQGDRTFALTLAHETEVVIELTDADPTAAVDTVVYVRSTCDDPDTQEACDDDVPCEESTVPGGCSGVEVRQSRIRTTLPAGTHYIVADAFDYETGGRRFRCGMVRLRVVAP